jgi:hypothetical protein
MFPLIAKAAEEMMRVSPEPMGCRFEEENSVTVSAAMEARGVC